MNDTENSHLFNIKPIINDVEKVIQNGLNIYLKNYIERNTMLEKTHEQLMKLPSIISELNKRKESSWINDSDSECDNINYDTSDFISIKDMTENIVRDNVSNLESKINKR